MKRALELDFDAINAALAERNRAESIDLVAVFRRVAAGTSWEDALAAERAEREVRRTIARMPGRQWNRPFLALHAVAPNPGGWFDVTSGRSGNVYRVTPVTPTYATCECVGFRKSPAPCGHVRAVWEFAETVMMEQGR